MRVCKTPWSDYWADQVAKLVIHDKPHYPDGKYLIKDGGLKVWRFNLRKERIAVCNLLSTIPFPLPRRKGR